jgi:hypothetical protein
LVKLAFFAELQMTNNYLSSHGVQAKEAGCGKAQTLWASSDLMQWRTVSITFSSPTEVFSITWYRERVGQSAPK